MTIKIEDKISDILAIQLVEKVVEKGKISGDGKYYCYVTIFEDEQIVVETQLYRKNPCFKVYKLNF